MPNEDGKEFKRVTVVLAPDDAAYIEAKLSSGEYVGASELIREALRMHRKASEVKV